MIETSPQPRVLGLLVGDIGQQGSGAWVKYRHLFAEIGNRVQLVGVPDVELRGMDRYQNALRSFQPSKRRWREAFHKNVWGFGQRSRNAGAEIARRAGQIDVVLQHGAIFHSHTVDGPPVVIYTDFTYRLAQREDDWRNPFSSTAESEHWNGLEQEAYNRAAFVLARSDHTRQSLLDDYHVAPERVATVGGGVNFDQLPEPAPLYPKPRVLFIGKDFERKGGDLLLQAFAQARQQVPEAELWLITAKEDVAGPGVRRIAPTYDRAAIAALYRESSVFAMPSRCETWGDVFLEAMAYGLPCIGTDSDAMPEIIQHGETGLLAPAGDIDALGAALVRLLRDADVRASMGARGHERVAASFTWASVADRIIPFLHNATSSIYHDISAPV